VDTCVGQGKSSGVCDNTKVVCASGGSTNGYGSQQAAAVKAAINNDGVHPNCEDPCEGIADGWGVGTNTYWHKQFKNAGLTDAQIGKICAAGSKWYYNSVDTCVGQGKSSGVCDNTKVVCASKGSTNGYGSQQAGAVKAAINYDGVHPMCPPPPQGVCAEFSGCLHYSLIRDVTCSGGQDTCDSFTCCDPLPYRILNGDCRSGIYDRDQKIEDADTIKIDGRDCWQACNDDPTCFGFDLPTTTSFDWCRMYTVNELRGNGKSILIDTNTQCYIKKQTPGQWGDYSSYEPLRDGDARCEDSSRTSYIRLEADDPIKQIEDPVRCARSCVANEECVMFQIKSNRRDGWTQCLLLRDYICKNVQGMLSFASYVPV